MTNHHIMFIDEPNTFVQFPSDVYLELCHHLPLSDIKTLSQLFSRTRNIVSEVNWKRYILEQSEASESILDKHFPVLSIDFMKECGIYILDSDATKEGIDQYLSSWKTFEDMNIENHCNKVTKTMEQLGADAEVELTLYSGDAHMSHGITCVAIMDEGGITCIQSMSLGYSNFNHVSFPVKDVYKKLRTNLLYQKFECCTFKVEGELTLEFKFDDLL